MGNFGKNTFGKGLNIDIDNSFKGDGNYIAANDICLTGNSTFLAAENIKGTLKVGTLISSFTGESTVLGAYANKYKIDGTSGIDCLTVMTVVPSGNFTIYCYRLDTNAVLTLYTEPFTAAFAASNPVLDAVVYPENNIDILYFTDGYSELRKLRCEISTPYTVTSEQLSLLRRGTLASLSLNAVTANTGALLSGSYQFSIRFYNSVTKTYSKWTIPSSPVVITKDDSGADTDFGRGGYNTVTSKSITMSVTSDASYIAPFDYYQFAVIENTGTVSPVVASLQPLQSLTTASFNYNYYQNEKISDVALADIVVDLAAVQAAKTLAMKNNRIFLGNIQYWKRDYDRVPTISGSVVPVAVANSKNNYLTSKYKGYFRNELYRFYIAYHDEYYNFSQPKKIDCTAFTSGTGTDMKFPLGRGGTYNTTDGSNNYQYLNLSLTVNNHPSWAKGFVILRAKRKKRVLFQTPLVPMSNIEGIDAMGDYPNKVTQISGSSTTSRTLTSATPMNSVGTYMPKNYFFTEPRDIKKAKKDGIGKGGSGNKGEAYYEYQNDGTPLYAVFPPETIYSTGSAETSEFVFENGQSVESTNIAFLKLNHSDSTDSGGYLGDAIYTSAHGTFYAKGDADYYFTSAASGTSTPQPASTDNRSRITGYKVLDNYGVGTSINGKYIGSYDNLETSGLTWYQKPNNQKMGIIELASNRMDTTDPARKTNQDSGTGVPSTFFTANHVVDQSIQDTATTTRANQFVVSKGGYSPDSTYASTVEIGNIVNSYDDTRYGKDEQFHDMVFTGASYIFTAAEVATVVSTGNVSKTLAVAGGDCYVSAHAFKITDSTYALTNANKMFANSADGGVALLNKWTYAFNALDPSGTSTISLSLPVALKNVSQVIQVILESEYNGETTGAVPYPTSSGIVTSSKESNWRVSFAYPYNFGMIKESTQKSFTPYNSTQTIVTNYPSRVLYSDQKVYNTDIVGFDVFRIANLVDLEDTYRGITKLAVSGDSLYAFQSQAVVYLPVDARVIGTADVNTMSIRTDKVIDIPVYISRQYGTQHLKSVAAKDDFVLFIDNINKAILRLAGQEIQNITDLGINTPMRSIFSTNLPSNSIHSVYDNGNRQYLFYSNTGSFCYVWDDRLQEWIGTQSYNTQNRLYSGVYLNTSLYVLGRNNANNLNVYKMYEGCPGQLFGNIVTPSITFIMNDNFEIAKTFDNVIVYSSDKMDKADITSERQPDVIVQQSRNNDIEVDRREGAYRVAFLRDDNGARIRGTRATITLRWRTLTSFDESAPVSASTVSLASVVTKYRLSARQM